MYSLLCSLNCLKRGTILNTIIERERETEKEREREIKRDRESVRERERKKERERERKREREKYQSTGFEPPTLFAPPFFPFFGAILLFLFISFSLSLYLHLSVIIISFSLYISLYPLSLFVLDFLYSSLSIFSSPSKVFGEYKLRWVSLITEDPALKAR